MTDLSYFGRRADLLIASVDQAINVSEFRFRFEVHQSDVLTPNGFYCRIYNLNDRTVAAIVGGKNGRSEFTRVVLQAGYEKGIFGVIFDGTIKQVGRGKEGNVDTYLDIWASEADVPYAFGWVAQTLGPGVTADQQLQALAAPLAQYGLVSPQGQGLFGGVLPRGKALYGMAKDYFRTLGQTTGTTLTFQDGTIVAIPLTGYLPGEAVVLNSQTGLVGVAETTQNGVVATALLNPKIRIGGLLKINNKDINQTVVTSIPLQARDGGLQFYASTNADGIYRVVEVDYEGDTRGNPWYCRITGLAVDPSAPAGTSVQPYG